MKLWKLDCDVDTYENLTWKKKISVDELQSFDGRKKAGSWKPVRLERIYGREYGNSIGLASHIPVFDKKAVGALKDFLAGNAEILPVDCEDGDFYMVNVIKVLDCIDYDKSEYKTFSDGIRIMRFKKYSFIENAVRGEHLFKIKDEPRRRPLVSDEFKQRVADYGLTGFCFELAWDSDTL